MTDEQLERRFSVVNEPLDPDPRFAADLFADLVDRLGLEPSAGPRSMPGTETVRPRRARRGVRPWRLLLAAALLAAGVAGGALLAGSLLHRDDLLTRIGASGVIRIAVRPDFPQVKLAGVAGFDVDVANELATRLGLGGELDPLPVTDMLGSHGTWDLAFPSSVIAGDAATAFIASRPYYLWRVYLLVPAGSPASMPSDLSGKRVCVEAGSSGEAWLAGTLSPLVTDAPVPPARPAAVSKPADRDCLTALGSGKADAMVTSTLSASDLAARPALRTVGGVLYTEPRSILASREGPDPTALLVKVDAVLDAMRSDGTLAGLSQSRFGGQDLSTPPRPTTNPS